MASTFTTNKHIEKPANGDYVNAWNVPVNADWDVVDAALGGTTTLTATSGTTTLNAAQYQNLFLAISGTLAGNTAYVIPAGIGGQWGYDTTGVVLGGYTLTISSGGGGASVNLGVGTGIVACNGTRVTFLTPVGGSNNQVLYNSAGVSTGSANLLFDGTNLSVGSGIAASTFIVNGAAGTARSVYYQTNGSPRWLIETDSTAEAGSNAGSNLTIYAYSDSGSALNPPISIARSTQIVTFVTNPYVSNLLGTFALGFLGAPLKIQGSTYALGSGDIGKCINGATGIVVPLNVFLGGNVIYVANTTGGAISITPASGVTLYLAGAGTTGTRTLANTGFATIFCLSTGVFLVSGPGVT